MSARTNDAERLAALHQGILQGDGLARESLSAYMLEHVRQIVFRRMPRLDETILNDAIEDALLHYLANPGGYDPRRARLDTLITLAATHNALNSIRGEQRRLRGAREVAQAWPLVDNSGGHVDDSGVLEVETLMEAAQTDHEREFLAARLAGERRTSVLAGVLDMAHLPELDQRREVKRVTDRLMLRMRRLVRARIVG